MRTTSNPVFRTLPQRVNASGYGSPTAGYGQQYPYNQFGAVPTTRPMTIDDVVTKTGITLGVVSVTALVAYALSAANHALAPLFVVVGGLVGFVLVLVATFGRKQNSPALVLSYAFAEGAFLGAVSYMFTNIHFGGVGGAALIGQAVLGTFGVFIGMLVVYKTGAIRVTPRFTRMVFGAMIGVLVLVLGNAVAAMFTPGGFGLRSGGTLSIVFSLIVIAVAAFNFLLDFDAADQLIRAQAPERAAWGVALGLTVTLVWLYLEILRLLSYLQNK